MPGKDEEFWENLIIEPLQGFKYYKTKKRFVEYVGKKYRVFKNKGNLEKRNFSKFYAKVPFHVKAEKIRSLKGYWLRLPHGLFKVMSSNRDFYYRETENGKVVIHPLVFFRGEIFWNSKR